MADFGNPDDTEGRDNLAGRSATEAAAIGGPAATNGWEEFVNKNFEGVNGDLVIAEMKNLSDLDLGSSGEKVPASYKKISSLSLA